MALPALQSFCNQLICLMLIAVAKEASCFVPIFPEAAWPSTCNKVAPGVVCSGTCTAGLGLLATTCQKDGTWSAVAGNCSASAIGKSLACMMVHSLSCIERVLCFEVGHYVAAHILEFQTPRCMLLNPCDATHCQQNAEFPAV